VAGGLDGAAGTVELDVPNGLLVDWANPEGAAAALPGPEVALDYELPPLGFAEWELSVRGAAGAAPGHYFLAARIHDQLGQVIEDAAAVYLGLPPAPALTLPLDELVPAVQADQQAITAELDVTVLTPALRVAAGQHGELAVRVASRAASPIRGEAQLISPFGSWPAVQPWTRGFAVSPGKEITLRYHVGVPVTTRRGTQWWTMVKLMYFGRLHYTSAVPVDVRE
jgi:alpha-mannosidase